MSATPEHLKRLDSRRRYYCTPSRIVSVSNPERVVHPEHLMYDSPTVCTITTDAQPEGLLLDFGAEIHGGLQILVKASSNPTSQAPKVPVRIRLGESVSEAMGSPDNDHALNLIETILPCQSRTEIAQTGFRFANIEILSPDTVIEICHIKAVELKRPWPQLGTFECDDAEINEIWNVAARTVHLCCQDHIWDGIKRDRVAWSGDMHPQMAAIASVFGKQSIVPDTLKFMADQTPPQSWINHIGAYSLWWIISLYDWYCYCGDIEMLESLRDDLLKISDNVKRHISPEGQETMPGRRLLDWPSHGNDAGIDTGIQTLCTWAVRCAGTLFAALKEESNAADFDNIYSRMKRLPQKESLHAQTLALRFHAGLAQPQKKSIESLRNIENISPWFGYYILNARAEMGDMDGCLDMLKQYWGGMVRLGATTFWEQYHPSWEHNASRIDEIPTPGLHDVHAEYGSNCYVGWRHSLCHGWSCGPCPWLSRYVLGMIPLVPGCGEFRILPHLGRLKYAKGSVPTPYGIISISHEKQSDGTVTSNIDCDDTTGNMVRVSDNEHIWQNKADGVLV